MDGCAIGCVLVEAVVNVDGDATAFYGMGNEDSHSFKKNRFSPYFLLLLVGLCTVCSYGSCSLCYVA